MSNYNALKAEINNNIYENQTQQITGTVLNTILNAMTASLGAGYQFAGVAYVGLNPSTPDQRVYYLAGEGVYTNFGGLQVPAGKLGILKWDSQWHLEYIDGLGGGGANLTGYITLASTDDLPEVGQPTLGYLIGTNLYLYVGEGGDTADGKYQNCGGFRGPEGAGITGVEQTVESHENGGRNTIHITLSNGQSYDVYVRNGKASAGLFPDATTLNAQRPNPSVGEYAFVGSGFPADIYVCNTAGTWTDSGEDYDGDNVDLTDYATKAELGQLEHKVDELEEGYIIPPYTLIDGGINTNGSVGTGTTYKHTSAIPVLKGQKVKVSTAGYNFALISKDENGTYTPQLNISTGDANVPATYTWTAPENMNISVSVKATIAYSIAETSIVLREIDGLETDVESLQNSIKEINGGEIRTIAEATIHGYINNNGGLSTNDDFRRTDYIEVSEGDRIYYKGYNSYPCLCGYVAKPSSGATILLAGTGDVEDTITIPAGVNYVVGAGRVVNGGTIYADPIVTHMKEEDGTIPTLQEDVEELSLNIGNLQELTTEEKNNLVDSINEVNSHFIPEQDTFDALDMVMDGDAYASKLWNIRSGYFGKATSSSYNCTNPIKVKVGDVIRCSTSISCSSPASSATTPGHLMFTEEGATRTSPTGFAVLPFDASVGEVTITQEMWDNGCRYVGFSFAVADTKTLTITRVVKSGFVCPKNIVKKMSNTHIVVYSQIHDDKYIEFNIKKEGTNTLYWRLQDSYFCEYDGDNFDRVFRVLSPSENEYVINVASGATDPHIGGYHGDEETDVIKFFCDGIAYGIDELPSSLVCDTAYYDEKSYMYGNDLGDPDAIITHYKKTFFNGGYVTENRIVALKQIPVSQFYAGLVCMDRNVGLHWTDDNLDIHTTDDNGGGGGEFNIADTGSSIVRYWDATNEVASMVETEIVDGDVQIPTVSIWSRSGSDHDAKYYRRGGGKTIQAGFTLSTRCIVKYNA